MADPSRAKSSAPSADVDAVCDEFERLWKLGTPEPIERFVVRVVDSDRHRLVRELALIDASYVQRNGAKPNWRVLAERLPKYSDAVRAAHQRFVATDETAGWKGSELSGSNSTDSAPSSRAASQPKLPKRFGRFEIRAVLGRGTFGTVFRAFDTKVQRDVALKIPRRGTLQSRDHVERFIREARAAGQLRHQSIVTVHDVGEVAGTIYIACEFIDGPTLQKALASGLRPTYRQAAQLMRNLAAAVHTAHSRGTIHRDLKPANILLDKRGRPHIADFGLARTMQQDSGLTMEGAVLGTPAYMSPEQAVGRGHLADARSDLWSLGIILYEILTGGRPFDGSTSEVLEAIRTKDPVTPRAVVPKLPRDLDTICMRCLAKDPEDRYPSAQHLAEELDRWRSGKPIQARKITSLERFARWARSNPALSSSLFLAVLTGVAGVIAVTSQWRRAEHNLVETEEQRVIANSSRADAERQQHIAEDARAETEVHLVKAEQRRKEAEEARQAEQSERERADSALRESHSIGYARNVILAGHEWRANNLSECSLLLDGCLPELRGWEWTYLKSQQRSPQFSCSTGNAAPTSAALCAGGTLAATRSAHGLQIWDLTKQRILRTIDTSIQASAFLEFSPDAKHLAALESKHLRVWHVDTGRSLTLPCDDLGPLQRFAFSPTGTHLLARNEDGAVRVFTLASGTTTLNYSKPISSYYQPCAFSSDGQRVTIAHDVYTVANGSLISRIDLQQHALSFFSPDLKAVTAIPKEHDHITVIDVDTSKELWSRPIKEWRSVKYSPDGTRMVVQNSQSLTAVDVRTGKRVGGMGLLDPTGHCVFVLNGKYCLFATSHGIHVLDPVTLAPVGHLLEPLLGRPSGYGTSDSSWIRFSADGRQAVTCTPNNILLLWDFPSGKRIASLFGHESVVREAVLLGDGKIVTCSDYDGMVRIWDLKPDITESVLDEKALVNSIAFDSEQHRLVTAINRGRARAICRWDLKAGRAVDETRRETLDQLFAPTFLSPDARYYASYVRGTGGVWDLKTDELLFSTSLGPTEELKAAELMFKMVPIVAFSGDGNRVAACWDQRSAHVWNMRDRNEVTTVLETGVEPYGVALTTDGSRIAIGTTQGVIKCVDCATKDTVTLKAEQTTPVCPLAFSPDNQWLACRSADRTVELWNVAAAKATCSLSGRKHGIFIGTFSPDSRRLVTLAEDGVIKLWEVPSGREVLRLEATSRKDNMMKIAFSVMTGSGTIPQIRFSPDGEYIVCNAAGRVQIWQANAVN